MSSGLHDGAYDTDKGACNHPEAASISVCARPCKEATCDVADDVECDYDPLVIGGDTEIGCEGVDGGEPAYRCRELVSTTNTPLGTWLTHRRCWHRIRL